MRFDPDDPIPTMDDPDLDPYAEGEETRDDWEAEFRDEFPDATEDQVEDAWRLHQAKHGDIECSPRRFSPRRPANWTPPTEKPLEDLRDPKPLTKPESVPDTLDDWNIQLRRDGLGDDDAYPDAPPTDSELERRLALRPEKVVAEARWLHDNVSSRAADGDNDFRSGITFLREPSRGGAGRRPSTDRATRVTAADGSVSFARIGNDRNAIREWLTKDGRTVEDYAPAVARGRRSSGANELRAELRDLVAELLGMGATQAAVAQVIGCSDKAIRALAK